ncbi:MAG: hypothetical protein ABIA37_03025 [Candidatus Woesearchaeota archaeon]
MEKIEIVNNVWMERFLLLNEFYVQGRILLKINRPMNQKLAIWRKKFDEFVLTLADQDLTIRKLIEK